MGTSGCAQPGLGVGEPQCAGEGTALVLELQAVPTAELVPCFRELAPGWELAEFEARDGAARFAFDSDRNGSRFLEVELGESCDVGDASAVPHGRDPRLPLASDHRDVERFVDVDVATPTKVGEMGHYRGWWFFRFDGGCVSYRFDASGGGVETLADEVAESLGWATRRSFAEQMERQYGPDYYSGGSR